MNLIFIHQILVSYVPTEDLIAKPNPTITIKDNRGKKLILPWDWRENVPSLALLWLYSICPEVRTLSATKDIWNFIYQLIFQDPNCF